MARYPAKLLLARGAGKSHRFENAIARDAKITARQIFSVHLLVVAHTACIVAAISLWRYRIDLRPKLAALQRRVPLATCAEANRVKSLAQYLAERGGFEPPVRYHRTLAFQASTLNHSATSPNFQFFKLVDLLA